METMARMGMPLESTMILIEHLSLPHSPLPIPIAPDPEEWLKSLSEMEANATAKKAKEVGRVPYYDWQNPRRKRR
jgi:hypothetical protein